jgi:disulfide bond formation protein DsbB
MLSTPIAPRPVLCLLALASAAILGTALASQYWGGLWPCPLCLVQRYPYAGAIVIAGLAAALPIPEAWRRGALWLLALGFVGGAGIAAYHVGVEQGWIRVPEACAGATNAAKSVAELMALLPDKPAPRCDEIPWSLLGISMAGYNAIASIGLAGIAGLAAHRGKT